MKRENRVTEIMNSLEGIQKAKTPRDGFAKIQQRLADQRKQQRSVEHQAGFGWMKIAAVIALVIASNIWAVSNYWTSNNKIATESGSYAQLMTDFNLYDNE